MAVLYSTADVERAVLRLNFQRLYVRRRAQSFFRMGAMAGSLLTGGIAEKHLIDIFEAGKELGMTELATLDTVIYLQREHLVKWTGLGGVVSLTQQGIEQIEGALAGKRTAYFPLGVADAV